MAMNWSDELCPSNPDHGRALATPQGNPTGMFCPHSEHHVAGTKFFWTFEDWEAAKTGKTATPTRGKRMIVARAPRRKRK